jgi:hypothetical protein
MAKSIDDLETRVEARKRELIAELIEHKKSSLRSGATEAIEQLRRRLTELAQITNENTSRDARNTRQALEAWIAR